MAFESELMTVLRGLDSFQLLANRCLRLASGGYKSATGQKKMARKRN